MNKYMKILALATLILSAASCTDFLSQENTTDINQGTYFSSDQAITTATAPLYTHVWNDFNSKFYYGMGDGRSNNITAQWSDYIKPYTNFNENALADGLQDAWASLYSVVAQSNNTINNILKYTTEDVSEAAKTQGIAEARFMRGVAYWYIASLWGNAILYTDTDAMVGGYIVPMSPRTDVMEFAIRDLEFAAAKLASTPAQAGRVTCWSAMGMLSRVYLSMAGLTTEGQYNGNNAATDFNRGTRNPYYLDLAARAAKAVIQKGNAELAPTYAELFDFNTINNNKESLFQLQWNTGSNDAIGWGGGQAIPSFFSWSTMVGIENWGGATCCSWELWNEYNGNDVQQNADPASPAKGVWPAETVRRHVSVASYGEEYPELGNEQIGSVYVYGITENASTNGANIKKYVVGNNKTHGTIYAMSYGINTYMLRLAEVYLNYCDAVLGNSDSSSDALALECLNAIHHRAGFQDSFSAFDYQTLRHERRMELAFEGQYWYDLVRRAYYKQQEVLNYLNNQARNAQYSYQEASKVYEISENYERPGAGVATATPSSFLLPVSDADKAKNHYLNEAPVAYEFEAREINVNDLF